MVETKSLAERVMAKVDALVEAPRPVRVHWTGCPNSCGQVQAADIGLMGAPAKRANAEGKMKAVAGAAKSPSWSTSASGNRKHHRLKKREACLA